MSSTGPSPASRNRRPIVDGASHTIPKTSVGPGDIAAELRRVARKGLPLVLARAGTILPNLRSVVARSVHPDDPVSRLDAANELLVRVLVDAGEDEQGEATRILFAVAQGTRGRNLTQRRASAAVLLGYDPDHFRKHVEPKLIDELAVAIHRDLLRYKSRAKRAPESLEPTGDTPSLDETHFTHQEELISRIWEKVYALRAAHIAVGRRERAAHARSMTVEIEEYRQIAAQEDHAVQVLIAEYVAAYGERLIRHGQNEFAVDGLRRLVGRVAQSG